MVALGVVAFRDGGVAAVGAVTAARMASAALLAPWLATMADRVRRERVLACVGVVRAATLGAHRGRHGRRRAGGRDVRARRRRHGRHDPLPAGALGAAACAGQVPAGADERERRARHAGLARDARRAARRGPPARRERPGARSSPRAPPRRCWPRWSSSRSRTTRRRGRRPPAAAAASCCAASPPSRPTAGSALITALGLAQTFTRGCLIVFTVVVAIDLLDTGDPGVGVLNAAIGAGGVLGLDLRVRHRPAGPARRLVRRRHRAVRRAARPDRRRPRAGGGDRPARVVGSGTR